MPLDLRFASAFLDPGKVLLQLGYKRRHAFEVGREFTVRGSDRGGQNGYGSPFQECRCRARVPAVAGYRHDAVSCLFAKSKRKAISDEVYGGAVRPATCQQ